MYPKKYICLLFVCLYLSVYNLFSQTDAHKGEIDAEALKQEQLANKNLEKQIKKLEQDTSAKAIENAKLKLLWETSQREIGELKKQIEGLKKIIEVKDVEIQGLNKRITELESEITSIRNTFLKMGLKIYGVLDLKKGDKNDVESTTLRAKKVKAFQIAINGSEKDDDRRVRIEIVNRSKNERIGNAEGVLIKGVVDFTILFQTTLIPGDYVVQVTSAGETIATKTFKLN